MDDKRTRRTSALSGASGLTDGDSGAEPVIETGLDGSTIVIGPVSPTDSFISIDRRTLMATYVSFCLTVQRDQPDWLDRPQ